MDEQKQKITVKQLLRNRILWKVYLVWFFRRIVPLIILQLALFILALRFFAKNVFVRQVFRNAYLVSEASYWSFLKYAALSFLNTNPLTQILILIILGIVALFLRDLIRTLITYKVMWLKR